MSGLESQSQARTNLVTAMTFLKTHGLNTGSAGNASCRLADETFLITPSGVAPKHLNEDGIVRLSMDGRVMQTGSKPSSEWQMHRRIYQARPEIDAVIHTHSTYATALACCRLPIPAFHYMVAVAGGDSIPLAPYATFGSEALSAAAVAALHERRACLLANHGVLALGADPAAAADLALEVEELARQYVIARQCGRPVVLDTEQMAEVLESFKTYGQ